MKFFYIQLFLFCFANSLFAQKPSGMPGNNLKIGRVYGRLFDEKKKPVAFATVALYVNKGKKDSLITGTLTEQNGEFNLRDLPFGRFKVSISYIGYSTFNQTVTVRPPDFVEQDLGNILLQIDATVLKELEITSEKSQSQLSLDRQVFNVGRNAASVGGTAEDVLRTVPSVTMDVDGNAKLRNNATTVYLDGRPTPVTLNQIPADQIERIEVITNPSAKFEAQTSGGIINIVSKQNKKPGYNGFVTLSAAGGERYNATVSLSLKEGKNNFTGFFNRWQSQQPATGYTNRTNITNSEIISYFNQQNSSYSNNYMQNGSLAWERTINNRNSITFTGNYRGGKFNWNEEQKYYLTSPKRDTQFSGTRSIRPDNSFSNYGGALTWKKSFPKKGREIVADVNYNRGTSGSDANWLTTDTYQNAQIKIENNIITGGNTSDNLIIQVDYTSPLNDSTKIEYGIRSSLSEKNQVYYNDVVVDGIQKRLAEFSQDFFLQDYINAAYFNFSSKWKGIGYQAGIRYEQSNLNGKSNIGGEDFGYNFPSSGKDILKSLFPAVYFSKKWSSNAELQFNMSRKINRPWYMQLMPVIRVADRQNIQIGNPALQPEFINLFEVNYNRLFKSNNWLISLYMRDEQNTIVPFAKTSPTDTAILINTYINGKSSFRVGIDNTLKLELNKKFEVTTNINAFSMLFRAQGIERKGYALNGKINASYKFPKDISLQTTYNYESPRIFLQGRERDNQFVDLALKKDITVGDLFPSKRNTGAGAMRLGSLTFSVSDLFNTRRNLKVFDTVFFTQEVQRRRDLRFFKVTLQCFFGKPDASIFKRKSSRPAGGESQMEF